MLSRLTRASWNLSRLQMSSGNACVYYQLRALGGDFLTDDKSFSARLLEISALVVFRLGFVCFPICSNGLYSNF